jgi:enamine deaminase RidA (YjgF/YER057c/UK114 family)
MASSNSSSTTTTALGAFLAGALLASIVKQTLQRSSFAQPIRAPGIKAWRMSKWVKYGGILRTQGLCGDFSKMPASTAQQTTEALEKLDDILKEAGLQRKNLIAVTC